MRDLARDLAEAFDAVAALDRRVSWPAPSDARHVKEESRIDAVVAGLDAVAGEQAAARPFARRVVARAVVTRAMPQNVDDAADHMNGILARRRR